MLAAMMNCIGVTYRTMSISVKMYSRMLLAMATNLGRIAVSQHLLELGLCPSGVCRRKGCVPAIQEIEFDRHNIPFPAWGKCMV